VVTVEKILSLLDFGIGSVENYANQLVKEMNTRMPKWYIVTPFDTKVNSGIISVNIWFICSKYQKQITEKEAFIEQDFTVEVQSLEQTLHGIFDTVILSEYRIVPNFSNINETQRINRTNFANVQVTSILTNYKLQTREKQLECIEKRLTEQQTNN
jgi:hypothetical protein